MRIVLASASPRRRELLALLAPGLGIEFEAIATGVSELTDGEPRELVVENAIRKAKSAVESRPGSIVLGVDTDVVIDREVLGKPIDEDQALQRIGALAGRSHEVLSGLAMVEGGSVRTDLVRTVVAFRELSEAEIHAYVASGEWRDRAGGYAVQGLGSSLVAGIEGDLSNVIGLPIAALTGLIGGLQLR